MSRMNVLVFPCGSEIALEVHRSLKHSIHFNLIGGSSIDDHGRFVFENYIGNLPFFNEESFIDAIKRVVDEHQIEIIYPAMDALITVFKQNEERLGCKVVGSESAVASLCLSKSQTYERLKDHILTPKIYERVVDIDSYPVFLKPDIGYGSRGALKAHSEEEIRSHSQHYNNLLISEFLPGKEYTVDCFSDGTGVLLFSGWRERSRIVNGISVHTKTNPDSGRFEVIARKINQQLKLKGAWFFQVKENEQSELVLLEVACRLGGSSSVYRQKGINFAYLSLYTALGRPVALLENEYQVEMDRALDAKYKVNIEFHTAYFDFDDTILLGDQVNTELIAVIHRFLNEKKRIILITRHLKNIHETLTSFRILALFDEIIHLSKGEKKSDYITDTNSIFVDDSFSERKEVHDIHRIPVFSPDMLQIFY